MGKDFFAAKSHKFLVSILLVFGWCMLMYGNGLVSLTHPDEVFYIESAKEMVENNKWFTPMIFDEVQFEKPFVAFAMFAGAIKYFGLNSSAARFWPALFGIIGIGVIYWITWIMFRNKRTAFISGVVLTTSTIYMALSRAVLTDMIFSVMIAVSTGLFYLAYIDEKHRRSGIIWSFVVSAIAVLTKGWLGICFPIAAMSIFSIYKKDFLFLKTRATWVGLGLFFLISVPWHVAMYMDHGKWFIDEYFHNVHIRRLMYAEHKRLDNWYFYLGLMFAGILPWCLFWVGAVKQVFINFKEKLPQRDQIFFLLAWILGTYVYVQPAASKLASYIFPAFFPIVILIAYTINRSLERVEEGENVKSIRFVGFAMSFILFAGIFVGIFFAKKYIDVIGSMTPVYYTCASALLISVLLLVLNLKKKFLGMTFSLVGISVTILAMLLWSRPYVEPWVSCKAICDVFKTIDNSDSTVIASKFYVRGVRYYTDRKMAVIDINGKGFWSPHPIPFMNTDERVMDLIGSQEVTYAVVKEGNVQDLKRILAGTSYVIDELDGIGGKFILRISQLNQNAGNKGVI